MPEIIVSPYQLTLEEKNELFFSLCDHLDLDIVRNDLGSVGVELRANGDAA